MKKVITKSKSGHYTACLNDQSGWHLYKAVKLSTLDKARRLLDIAKTAIKNGTWQELRYTIHGDFSEIRIGYLTEQKQGA